MADDQLAGITVGDARRLSAMLRRLEQQDNNRPPLRPNSGKPIGAIVEGYLLDDLHQAPYPTGTGTLSTARLKLKRGEGNAWADGETITVTNRSETSVWYEEDYLAAIEMNGEFRPITPCQLKWRLWKNSTASECPAYGVLKAASFSSSDPWIGGIQSAEFGSQFNHFLNGPTAVDQNEYGVCTRDPGARAAYDNATFTPSTIQQEMGPRSGSWLLKSSTFGFIRSGVLNTSDHWVQVDPRPWVSFIGKVSAAGTLPQNSEANVDIYFGPWNALVSTGQTVAVSNIIHRDNPGTSRYILCQWMHQTVSSDATWTMTSEYIPY